MSPPPSPSSLFPYTTLFRSAGLLAAAGGFHRYQVAVLVILHGLGGFFCEGQVVKVGGVPISLIGADHPDRLDRKSTRLNSSHVSISYAVFCLKKKDIYIVLA